MDNQRSEEYTFHAGICMAGAVSAGAYTAGVMDYLLETLEHWEKARALQAAGKLQGIPKHKFLIEVLGGASAGGMTAAIAAVATQYNFNPVRQQDGTNEAITGNNPLYNSWVNLKEGNGRDMMDYMLNTDDIEKDNNNSKKEVRAGFNSSFIADIAGSMLDKRFDTKYERPYVAKDVEVFTTITNLRGFNYKVKFETSTGIREHRMKMHRDYAFFKLSDSIAGSEGKPFPDAPENAALSTGISETHGRIPVNFNYPDGLNTHILKQAAMATGAFPVGLESRDLTRERIYIEQNKYLNLMLTEHALHTDVEMDSESESINAESGNKKKNGIEYEFLPRGEEYLSLNVDGGVINNEPYEITQQLLDDRRRNTISDTKEALAYTAKTSAKEFDSMVLMIDPFPNDDETESDNYQAKKAWRNVLPSILSAMRGQLMMKDEQIKRAYLSDDYTRFLIMPVRTLNGLPQKYTIACGSLEGFGGFFSKDFRKHDFYLGRRNCQQFLQKHFTVPANAENPILKYGYEGIDTTAQYGVTNNKSGITYLPIVPDLRIEGDDASGYRVVRPPEEKEYPYPKIKLSYLLSLKERVEKRIKCILDNIQNVADDHNSHIAEPSKIVARLRKKSWFKRQFDNLVSNNAFNIYLALGKFFGKGAAADAFIDTIIADMEKRGLIEEDV